MMKIQINNNHLDINKDDVREEFCKRRLFDKKGKLDVDSKCSKFYFTKIESSFKGECNCPYGYTCIFLRDKIIGSIIDRDYSNLKLIKGHYSFLNVNKLNYCDTNYIDSVKKLDDLEENMQIRSNAFHDLKNSTTIIKDLYDNYKYCLNDELVEYINSYFLVFENHNIKNNDISKLYDESDINKLFKYYNERIKLYDESLDKIKEIAKSITALINVDIHEKIHLFYDFFEFVHYRIRYFNRIINIEHYKQKLEIKQINLHQILYKLKRMLEGFSSRRNINIIFNCDDDNFIISSKDDIFLICFILLENSIKYSLMEKDVYIKLYKENNRVIVEFINSCEPLNCGEIDKLLLKGYQGSNSKNGTGLGLYMANKMLISQGFSLKVDYINNNFISKICF